MPVRSWIVCDLVNESHCQINRALSLSIGIRRLPGEQAEESLDIPVWGQKMQANIMVTDRGYDWIESYRLRNGPMSRCLPQLGLVIT